MDKVGKRTTKGVEKGAAYR